MDLMTFPYNLDNWERKEIFVDGEDKKLRRAVIEAIYAYKSKRIERMIRDNQQLLHDTMKLGGEVDPHLEKQMTLERIKKEINDKQIKEVAGERHDNNPRARATLLQSRRWAYIEKLLEVRAMGEEHTCSHDAPHLNALPVQMLGQVMLIVLIMLL